MHRRRLAALASVAAVGAGYARLVRPWTNRLGATDEELRRPLRGDAVVPDAGYCATRAITIQARPEQVWPWLVQMGSGRGGWYALDRLDNAGTPSARSIVPDLQNLRVGDLVPMAVGRDVGPRVREIEPHRRMLWTAGDEFSWEWVLDPLDDSGTRLVNRIRERYPPLLSRRMLYALVASSGDVVMNWMQLRGIRARAERAAAADAAAPPEGRR